MRMLIMDTIKMNPAALLPFSCKEKNQSIRDTFESLEMFDDFM